MPYRSTTPSGTEILIDPIPNVRSCSVGFWVKRGSCWERPEEEGLAHFIEHTVFKGTARYPEPQVMAEATDRLGGSLDAFTGKEVACFYGKVLAEKLPDLVDLLGELVTTPTFEEEELVRERGVILEEISQSEDQPDDWVSELFYAHFWPGNPLAHSILGRREQVASYGPDQARAFFQKTYRAPNLLIAAAGDIETGAFLELLQPILALPMYLVLYLPSWLGGMGLAGILFSIVGSIAGLAISSSTRVSGPPTLLLSKAFMVFSLVRTLARRFRFSRGTLSEGGETRKSGTAA